MAYSEDLLIKRIEDVRFCLRLYENYSRKMPSDRVISQLCEKYRSMVVELVSEYNENRSF